MSTSHDRWLWQQVLRLLDERGLTIVPKRDPAMDKRGLSAARKDKEGK